MWAFMESKLLASRKQMITCLLPCIVHILHRSVVPILQTDHIHVELYRTGHVLIESSYWVKLYNSVMKLLMPSTITVVHNFERTPGHAEVANKSCA